ncbi:MAG: sulfatase-like hydrolase/transferase [Marinicellaceae bacterium]
MYVFKLTDLRIRYFFVFMLLIILISCNDNKPPPYNVVIVTFDTTRADHIGSYSQDAYTPNLDKFAKDSIVYERALAPIAITLPSHSTIMTGKVPFVHGVRDNGLFNLDDSNLTIAEILKSEGYNTGAAIASFPLTSQFGIDQGFDYYNDYVTQQNEDIYGDLAKKKDRIFFDERRASQVNSAIMPWLETNHQSPFLTWIHYFDPHHPHEPPAPYDQNFINDLYKGEIAYSDESFGKLIDQLKRLNQYDNTMIIFTSDHGEGNYEHNEATHSMLIYNSTLHVPLIIKYPKQKHAGTRVSQWVGIVDIFPSILNELGLESLDDIQGEILPTADGETAPKKEIYSETLSPRFSRGWGEQRGLVKNGYKYIHGPEKELYNLETDFHEIDNIIQIKPELADSMKSDLQSYLDEYQTSASTQSTINQNPETLDILRGLGYIQSTGKIGEEIIEVLNDEGDSPQSHADMVSTYSAAKNHLFSGKQIEAIRFIDILINEDPGNLAYIELKIQAEIDLGNFNNAIELLENLPNDSYGTLTPSKKLHILASLYQVLGDINKSKSLYLDSENIKQTREGQKALSEIYLKEGNLEKQRLHLNNLLTLIPNDIKTLNGLAINYAKQGEYNEAENIFNQAIDMNPLHHLSYFNYGVFLTSVNDDETAATQYEKAIELNPNYIAAYMSLINTYMIINEPEKAEQLIQKLERLAPNSAILQRAKKLLK